MYARPHAHLLDRQNGQVTLEAYVNSLHTRPAPPTQAGCGSTRRGVLRLKDKSPQAHIASFVPICKLCKLCTFRTFRVLVLRTIRTSRTFRTFSIFTLHTSRTSRTFSFMRFILLVLFVLWCFCASYFSYFLYFWHLRATHFPIFGLLVLRPSLKALA